MEYPTRCEIVDVTGHRFYKTPDISMPHIGKKGLAEITEEGHVRITLDDDSILYGYECWWKPVTDESSKVR